MKKQFIATFLAMLPLVNVQFMRKKRILGKKMEISILNKLKLSNFKRTCSWSIDKSWNWTQQMCGFFQVFHVFAGEALSKSNIEEVLLALKALGNVGHPASIKHIKKFLPGYAAGASELPLKVHETAVMALKSIGMRDPKMVRKQSCFLCTYDKSIHWS